MTAASFEPAWWLDGAHAQTIWANLCRRPPAVPLSWERLETPDGDFLEIAWHALPCRQRHGPLVLILHGLAGCAHSPYASVLSRK